ncbi:MAG TPA: hypothetical protein VFI42_14775 [Thermomicrobiaceae bacterium]|nr:hypothetical protein [Thermomicrobiaceae bacterium]
MDRQEGNAGRKTSGTTASGDQSKTTSKTQQADQLKNQVKQNAGEVADTAQQTAQQQFHAQKQQARQGLGSVSSALHQAADQMRGQKQDTMAQLADMAADQVNDLSGFLQQENLHRVIDQVEDFARNQPYLFLGGAFALGAVAARFLKASRPENAHWGRTNQPQNRFAGRNYGPLNYPGVHYAGSQPYPSGFGTPTGSGSSTGAESTFGRSPSYGGTSTGFNRGTVTTGSGVSHESAGDDMGRYPNVTSPEGGASTRLPGEREERGHATK